MTESPYQFQNGQYKYNLPPSVTLSAAEQLSFGHKNISELGGETKTRGRKNLYCLGDRFFKLNIVKKSMELINVENATL